MMTQSSRVRIPVPAFAAGLLLATVMTIPGSAQTRYRVAMAAIHMSFARIGRPAFFSDTRTRAYATVVGSVTARISKSAR